MMTEEVRKKYVSQFIKYHALVLIHACTAGDKARLYNVLISANFRIASFSAK